MRSAVPVAAVLIVLTQSCRTVPDRPADFVTARGRHLYTARTGGERLTLRGVNAGGWLLTEDWMTPTGQALGIRGAGQYVLEDTLSARFGRKEAADLIGFYRDRWWTEEDFDRIAEAGLNCIRLPFGWRDLITADGKPVKGGFDRIDRFIESAGHRGLYTILDLHGAPGSQNGRDHSGDTREHRAFTDPSCLKTTCALWRMIAARYADDTRIAAYDVYNEPEGVPNGLSNAPGIWEGMDAVYRAIREVDRNHVVTFCACWWIDHLPPPSKFGWTNVMYQYHFYQWAHRNDFAEKKKWLDEHVADEERRGHGVPVYIGEFNFFENAEVWRYGLELFERNGWSWTIWSYKASGRGEDIHCWGLYSQRRDAEDTATPDDSANKMRERWARLAPTSAFTRNDLLFNVIRSVLR